MKKYYLLLVSLFILHPIVNAQVSYSYSLADILAAMPAGIKLPDGTYIKVEKISTGTGVVQAGTGAPGPIIGGFLDSVWSGCTGCTSSTTTSNTLPAYTGDKDPVKFSRLVQNPARNIDRGSTKNAADAIGWRIYFDRPLDINSFLVVDLDGNQAINGEWSGAFSYNGNAFSNPTNKTFQTNNLQAQNITVNATHAWRTMLQAQIGAAAMANFPSANNGFNITRVKNIAGALDPDDLRTQVLYDFSLATDLFFLWGVWGTIPNANNSVQNSGISPIVVNVFPDFGDAPDTYQTLLSNNGASHGQRTSTSVNELKLGATEDIESDGLPSAMANSSMDDDGLMMVPPIVNDGSLSQTISSYTLTTSFTNLTGNDADFVAWIDWNNNGVFDASEGQTVNVAAATTTGNVSFTWTNTTLTGAAGLANTYARMRVTTDSGMTVFTSGGSFKDGEVEDYMIPFNVPLPLSLIDFTGSLRNQSLSLNWQSADEIDVDVYEIEMSDNALDFHRLAVVDARNESSNHYRYNDELNQLLTNVYFRLKIIDIDGSFNYSPSLNLINQPRKEFSADIVPNPMASEINFVYENSLGATQVEMKVVDLTGKTLLHKVEYVENGQRVIRWDASELAEGLYILHYADKKHHTKGSIKFSIR